MGGQPGAHLAGVLTDACQLRLIIKSIDENSHYFWPVFGRSSIFKKETPKGMLM
jgi:hypothetical protein